MDEINVEQASCLLSPRQADNRDGHYTSQNCLNLALFGFSSRGFSLIELLAVIAILSLLATLIAPAITSITRGSNLNRGGQIIVDQFAIARQEAVSKNCAVEVRFYQLASGLSSRWRGIQLWRIEQTPTGPKANAISRISVIPEGIEIANNSLSPLITQSSTGTVTLSAYGSTSYRAVRFGASGSIDSLVGDNNYLTLINSNDTRNPLANYYTIQINQMTGKASVFRP